MHIRELQEKKLDYFFNALKQSAIDIENGIGNRFLQDKQILQNAIFR